MLIELAVFKGFVTAKVKDLLFSDNYCDWVAGICLFHKLDYVIATIFEKRRVFRVVGEISILLSTDPGLGI